MHDRREGRPSHVRPRTPSTGRPAPVKAAPRPAASGRVPTYRRVEPPKTEPRISRAVLLLVIVALAVAAMFTMSGTVSRAVLALTRTVDGMIDSISATPSPRPTVAIVADAPLIQAPEEPYTADPSVDLVVIVPADAVGDARAKVRVYRTLPDERPKVVLDVPIGEVPELVVPVTLVDGHNPFSATLVGPGGESEPSPVVNWVLDRLVPRIKIYGPPPDEKINRQVATVTGKTQSRAALSAKNETNGESVAGRAKADGTFEILVPIVEGPNRIVLTSTDPAGNKGETTLDVLGGEGKLTAELSVEPDELSMGDLPAELRLRVVVKDPDERPLENADVTFSIQVPGIPAVQAQRVTDAKGEAVYSATVPEGATVGGGLATVLIQSAEFGEVKGSAPVTIAE